MFNTKVLVIVGIIDVLEDMTVVIGDVSESVSVLVIIGCPTISFPS